MFGVSGLCAQRLTPTAPTPAPRLRARLRYALWVCCWVVSHVAGGALLGGALGWLGARLSPAAQAVGLGAASAGCLAGALHHLGVVELPLPHCPRQVPRAWMFRWPCELTALGYGLQLGSGVLTRIKSASFHAALGLALLCGSAAGGATVLGLFGLARALPAGLLGPWLASPVASLAFARRLEGHGGWVGRLNGAALLAGAALLGYFCWTALTH
jgi:hypothetical protein